MFLKLAAVLICFEIQNSVQIIQHADIYCAVLDGMYVQENFEKGIAASLEKTTNLAGNPLMEFAVKFPAAIITYAEGFSGLAATVLPIFYDTMKVEYENKEALARLIVDFEKREDVRKKLIEAGIAIAGAISRLERVAKNPSTMCHAISFAHYGITSIVAQFSSRYLPYHDFPSATAQLMLTMTPIATMMSKALPHLEFETNTNCKLRDLFDDLFQIALLHRLQKIQTTLTSNPYESEIFNTVTAFTVKKQA